MRYFKNKLSGEVFAFDEAEQGEHIDAFLIDTDTYEEVTGNWPPPPPVLTLAELIANQIAQINRDFELAMQKITTGYPPNEITSWSKQETEARAYVADANAATPLLDALAEGRGLTKADLASRILYKADLFAAVSGQLIGKRQGLEDVLDALPGEATAEDVEAVVWDV